MQNSKKSFWWHVFRTKDDQTGLNKQMIMSTNKKINDKNNSKLKTLQIINYEIKQSKMMFLFIFVLFQQYSSSTWSNFISWIFDDEYHSLTFVFFYLCMGTIINVDKFIDDLSNHLSMSKFIFGKNCVTYHFLCYFLWQKMLFIRRDWKKSLYFFNENESN